MENITIILTDNALRFDYSDREIIHFRRIWAEARKAEKDTIKVVNIVAEKTGLIADNVMLLALDQARKGKIT